MEQGPIGTGDYCAVMFTSRRRQYHTYMSAPRLRTGLLLCAVLAAAAGAALFGRFRASSHNVAVAAQLRGTDVWPAGTQLAQPFALHDQRGALISTAALRGHVWAITFLDSNCRELWPTEARSLARVQQLLGPGTPLSIVIVSVLPRYDTPRTVTAFAHTAGLSGDWHWLLGTERQLQPVWHEYGIAVITGQQHTAALYLVDRTGHVRVADAIPFRSGDLAGSIKALNGSRG